MTFPQDRRLADQTLPMYPGYGMGSLIQNAIFELPLIKRELEYHAKAIEVLNKARQDAASEKDQAKSNIALFELSQARKAMEKLNEKIKRFTDEADFSRREQMLPIDSERSPIRIEKRAFPQERLLHVILSQDQSGNVSSPEIATAVEEFVADLCLQDVQATALISPETVRSLVRNVQSLLRKEEEITLIGSFVSLSRVRVMDPLILRREEVSEVLRQDANKYSVITEVVLGGVFLGYGKSLSTAHTTTTEQAMSSLSLFSFISQGAIPKVDRVFANANLWQVYQEWKDILMNDRDSGYPIAMKVRDLSEILRVNKCLVAP